MIQLFAVMALGLAFVLPGHYAPWESFEQEALAIVALGLFAARCAGRGPRVLVEVPRLAINVALLAVVPVLQDLFGWVAFVADGVVALLYLLLFSLAVCCGSLLARSERRGDFLNGLAVACICAGTLSVLLACLQWQGRSLGIYLTDLPPGGRPFANLGQPNHLATLLGLMAMGVLYLFESRKLGATASIALALWGAWGLAMTQSRTGWLFVALLCVWWFAMRRRASLRTTAPAITFVVTAFVAMVVLWEPLNDALLLSTTSMEERLQGGTRLLHWRTLWQAVWLHPWFGWGWGQVGVAQQAVALNFPASHEWINNSHNLVLDLLIWNGVPLGLMVIGVLTTWFVRRVRACRSSQAWALMVGIGAIFTHAMLEFPLDYAYFLIPAGLLMGAIDVFFDFPAPRTVPRVALVIPALLIAVLCGWIAAEYVEVRAAATQLRYLLRGFDTAVAEGAPPPKVTLLDSLRAYHEFWLTPPDRPVPPDQLDRLRKTAARYATGPAMMRYARIAAESGRPDEAGRSLGLLCKLHTTQECIDARASWAAWAKDDEHLAGVTLPLPEGPVPARRASPHPED